MCRKSLVFIILFIVFSVDRSLKFIIDNNLLEIKENVLSNNLISFVKVYNTGAAFGVLQGKTVLLSVFSIIIVISLIYYVIRYGKNLKIPYILGIGMILGGTAGNLFDRLLYGYVIDFIKLNFIDFPVFNIADIFINIGLISILIPCISNNSDT